MASQSANTTLLPKMQEVPPMNLLQQYEEDNKTILEGLAILKQKYDWKLAADLYRRIARSSPIPEEQLYELEEICGHYNNQKEEQK